MNRVIPLAALIGAVSMAVSLASGQGIGHTDASPGYGYSVYHSQYPIQVRPSGYAAGYTYTLPPIYPYQSYYYRYPGSYPYTYQGTPLRGYRTTPIRSGYQFGPAHASQYFGNPHASQYFGR